jgi:hypothetical protein
MLVISSTVPLAGCLATYSAAITPPAPALFSTVTGTPHARASFCAITRAITSVPPPGGKPTTMRTGAVGSGDAAAKEGTAAAAVAARPETMKWRLCMVRLSPSFLGMNPLAACRPPRAYIDAASIAS